MLRIILADNNRNSRSALALLLETRLEADIVGQAVTMEELLRLTQVANPDAVILDWELPGKPETDRIVTLRSVVSNARIIILSARPESAQQASGADSFVNKFDPPEVILSALQGFRATNSKY